MILLLTEDMAVFLLGVNSRPILSLSILNRDYHCILAVTERERAFYSIGQAPGLADRADDPAVYRQD